MLAVQMAATHVAMMRSARWLANAETIDQLNAHSNGYTKLTRAYTAQMEALRKHRNGGKARKMANQLAESDYIFRPHPMFPIWITATGRRPTTRTMHPANIPTAHRRIPTGLAATLRLSGTPGRLVGPLHGVGVTFHLWPSPRFRRFRR